MGNINNRQPHGNRYQNGNRQPPRGNRAQREEYIRRRRAEEARREAIRREREKLRKKKERKEKLSILGGRAIVFLIILLIVALLSFVLLMLHFNNTPDSPMNIGKIKYFYGGAEVREATAEECAASGGIYICFNDLSDYIGMAESGSAAGMKFLLPSGEDNVSAAGSGKEEYVVFFSDTTKAVINGQTVTLRFQSVIHGEEIWVPSSFVEDYMNGLSLDYNEKKSTVSIARVKDEEKSTDKETVYADISFKLKPSVTSASIDENPLFGDVVFGDNGKYDLDFSSDLSEYEEYMNPQDTLRDSFLTLVNEKNPLTEGDAPRDLIDVKHTSVSKNTQQLRLYAEKSLEALIIEMHSADFWDMAVYGGYRSYSYQQTQFEQYISNEMAANPNLTREAAEKIVLTYAARPGTSEHQTGLAVDMDTMGAFSTDFQYTDEYGWLTENAWKFGFILRYPDGKTDITGNAFEPWHFRYVGRYHALRIHESGLTLEEYLKEIKK